MQTNFQAKVRGQMVAAYAILNGEAYTNRNGPVYPVVVCTIGGETCFASIDPQFQHPEHDGIARTISDKAGRVLAQSLTASWGELKERAAANLRTYP